MRRLKPVNTGSHKHWWIWWCWILSDNSSIFLQAILLAYSNEIKLYQQKVHTLTVQCKLCASARSWITIGMELGCSPQLAVICIESLFIYSFNCTKSLSLAYSNCSHRSPCAKLWMAALWFNSKEGVYTYLCWPVWYLNYKLLYPWSHNGNWMFDHF